MGVSMWWVRFEIRSRQSAPWERVWRGFALVDLSPNEFARLREAGEEVAVPAEEALVDDPHSLRDYLGFWPPVLRLQEIEAFSHRHPGPGEQVLLREPKGVGCG